LPSPVAKLAPRRGTRIFRRHSPFQILLNQELNTGFDLLFRFTAQIRPSSQHPFDL
jgi:hypothetical protein